MKSFTRISKGRVKWIDEALVECESDLYMGKENQPTRRWKVGVKQSNEKRIKRVKKAVYWNRNNNISTDGERIKEKVEMYTIWHSVSFRHVYFAHLYRKRAESGGKIDQQNIDF